MFKIFYLIHISLVGQQQWRQQESLLVVEPCQKSSSEQHGTGWLLSTVLRGDSIWCLQFVSKEKLKAKKGKIGLGRYVCDCESRPLSLALSMLPAQCQSGRAHQSRLTTRLAVVAALSSTKRPFLN